MVRASSTVLPEINSVSATLATAIAVSQPETSERRLIDNPLSVDLFKFHPHAQHIAAISPFPNCSNGVRLVKLAQIFRVFDGSTSILLLKSSLALVHSFTPS